ncbi:hypothetical protein ACFPDQ_00420 [Pseudofrancisella aestuarii]|uniref:Uncharacterized protein n=1 Tax=Pseudofrancisella aestuarii TaxID=2670347 RepID=A0ABV9TA06_9GAMM|nr:hypothetical protein [Pseudofrancisella aestuarii]
MRFFLKLLTLFIFVGGIVYAETKSNKATEVEDINTEAVLLKDDKKDSQNEKENISALDTVEMYEGEALVPGSTFDIGQTILNTLNINKVQIPFFSGGIDNNVVLSQAMMNTQQETGDPLFILLSRQNGLLKDDTLYLGGDAAFLPTWGIQKGNNEQDFNSINNYQLEYYLLSTLGDWTSVFASLSTYTTNGSWTVAPGGVYFILGNLKESPFYTYAALSTVNFGNFDISSNYMQTFTRLYFMQSGGNVNLSYNRDGVQANFVFLGPTNSGLLSVANAYEGSAKLGYSINLKYTHDMEQVGDYWYAGAAYSNVSGFATQNNGNVGVVDFNFGINVDRFNFINEFVFTDSGVSQITDNSSSFQLREGFTSSIFPALSQSSFLTGGSRIYSWSSQLDYTIDFYDKSLIPYISYSQIQQNTKNYGATVDTGFRYNAFADAWLGFGYAYVTATANDVVQKDNLLSIYFRIFI